MIKWKLKIPILIRFNVISRKNIIPECKVLFWSFLSLYALSIVIWYTFLHLRAYLETTFIIRSRASGSMLLKFTVNLIPTVVVFYQYKLLSQDFKVINCDSIKCVRPPKYFSTCLNYLNYSKLDFFDHNIVIKRKSRVKLKKHPNLQLNVLKWNSRRSGLHPHRRHHPPLDRIRVRKSLQSFR